LIVSAVYVLACRVLQLVVLLARGERSKEFEILVLRHELAILRRQQRTPRFSPSDRLLLAALSRAMPREILARVPGDARDAFALASTAPCQALDLPRQAPRTTTHGARGARADRAHGARERHLGLRAHRW
jgi:hypothetical protein